MEKRMYIFFILSLYIIFMFSCPITAEDIDSDINKTMSDILKNADNIISSDNNVTTATQLLASLPERSEKPHISIYAIEDKTGKRDMTGSPVLTQGATDMMITALLRSRQFIILDRSFLGNFMNEQSLVLQERTKVGSGVEVGNIISSQYIISGAITEYQIDKSSGGLGISIGGKGGQQEFALASCALDIRLINSSTGEVVWGRSFKKELVGKKISFQVFSFMGNNIVEFETGKGKQEVINLVIRTLIEEAVFELVETYNF